MDLIDDPGRGGLRPPEPQGPPERQGPLSGEAATRSEPGAGIEIDGVRPRRVVRAERVEDVADAIRAANTAREAIVLRGGATRLGIGDQPERYDTCLDLRGLSRMVEFEPADLVATVGAGMTLRELAAVLAEQGLRWPVEAGAHDRATVGGTIASAAGGPSRLRYFHPRDWTIGVQAVLGDGSVTRAGGRVVKNVTGYDLTKLYAGSFGTLCAITEVSLKLAAIPERQLTLRAESPTLEHAHLNARTLLQTGLPLDALAVLDGPHAGELGAASWIGIWVRLAGSQRVVDRLKAEMATHLPFVEDDPAIWQRLAALPLEAETSLRLSWPAGSAEIFPGTSGGLLYPGVETLHAFGAEGPEEVRLLRTVLEGKGGALVVERAPGTLRRDVGTWGTPRTPTAIARALKERFDPNNVLAPGRMAYS